MNKKTEFIKKSLILSKILYFTIILIEPKKYSEYLIVQKYIISNLNNSIDLLPNQIYP